MGNARFLRETWALGGRAAVSAKITGTLYEVAIMAAGTAFISLERLTFLAQRDDDVPKIGPSTTGMTKVERGQRLSRHKAEAADEPDD